MGVVEFPEIKFAKKIIEKHSITIPFDIEDLVKKYAKIIYKLIPIEGVDGLCVNLKTPGKKPKIILNTSIGEKRRKFTLAHELGHIIIPWHVGTIVDDTTSKEFRDYRYGELEAEANRFASELLMPQEWLKAKFIQNSQNISVYHKNIVELTGVSWIATAIAIIKVLPPNYIFVIEEFGFIVNSGKSPHTLINNLPINGTLFSDNFFPYVLEQGTNSYGNEKIHWYLIGTEIPVNSSNVGWREILDVIIDEINLDKYPSKLKFKQSINGIISAAHGEVKRYQKYDKNNLYTACLYKLQRDKLDEFINHNLFNEFLTKRVIDFFRDK